MKSKLRIILFSVLLVLCIANICSVAISLFNLLEAYERLTENGLMQEKQLVNSALFYCSEFFFPVILLIISTIEIVCYVQKSNLKNSVRYTYEQYKESKEKKKAEKQKAKKEKLTKKLNELEKDTK